MPADPRTQSHHESLINRLLNRRDVLRRRVLRHRGVLAAAMAALTAYLAVHALSAPPPPTEAVWVASRDLASGTTLARSDLAHRSYREGTVPHGIVTDPRTVVGRTISVPIHAGMPVATDGFVGTDWLTGYPGLSAVPARVTDPAVAALLAVGDRVDLLATDPDQPSEASTLVGDAVVLALPPRRDDAGTAVGSLGGRLVVFGVPPEDAAEVGAAGLSRFVTVVWASSKGG